jgi:hypothetical protein
MTEFKSGQSGNPGGRPKGALHKRTLASQALLVEEPKCTASGFLDTSFY